MEVRDARQTCRDAPVGGVVSVESENGEKEETMVKKSAAVLVTAALVLTMGLIPGVAQADSGFPSTNDANREAGHPHVNLVDAGEDYVILEFVMNYPFLVFFEYRIDGEESPYIGTEWENIHPIVDEDGNWRYDDPDFPDFTDPGPGNYYHLIGLDPSGDFVDPRVVSDTTRVDAFNVEEKIEVRLALGAERDYDFDWVTFHVKEYDAAPAVAARLLEEAGIPHRYGSGPRGGNHVADVAHAMGGHEDDQKGTDFWGVCKTDEFEYALAIAHFLNTKDDPAPVIYPENAVQSVVFCDADESGSFGSDVGDEVVITFKGNITKVDNITAEFSNVDWAIISHGEKTDDEIAGNILTFTVNQEFTNPRSISGKCLVSITGLVDSVGNEVVVPQGGVPVETP